MTQWKKYLSISLISAALCAGLLLLVPHRGEAQYATPVRVTNSSSAPAIGSTVDEPGRIPYVSQSVVLGQNCDSPFLDLCFLTFPAVPAGRRLVIEQVSGFIQMNVSPSAAAEVAVLTNNDSTSAGPFVVNALNVQNSNELASFNQQYLAYLDAGDAPAVSVQALNTTFPNSKATEVITLKGYLIDCTAAPCAPIAH